VTTKNHPTAPTAHVATVAPSMLHARMARHPGTVVPLMRTNHTAARSARRRATTSRLSAPQADADQQGTPDEAGRQARAEGAHTGPRPQAGRRRARPRGAPPDTPGGLLVRLDGAQAGHPDHPPFQFFVSRGERPALPA
jgi:hypothetical protein